MGGDDGILGQPPVVQPKMPVGGGMRCSYSGCICPVKSPNFFRIEAGRTSGGQDWSSLAGRVLCNACYKQFERKGTLERTASKPFAARRCTYEHCDKPGQSRNFYSIEAGRTSGGQDWSSLAGKVLCNACFQQFKTKATLERTASKPLAASARRCTYEHCDKPGESSRFLSIEASRTSGGQDWSSLAGKVLCNACYLQFKTKATLERTASKPLAASARRCTYEHCDKPGESSRFLSIEASRTSGGQDWSSLAGRVLCKACYERFKRKGTLERTASKPLAASARRCTYEHCDKPGENSRFFFIEASRTSGGQDWSSLAGKVLCNACYQQFLTKGTLERTASKPLAASARRCTYEHCDKPGESSNFFSIEAGRTSGGQDWSSLAGKVLCNACYWQFLRKGTLERTASKPLAASARRCTYEHCDKPGESRNFHSIRGSRTAGGQDWSSVAGKVLCDTCYSQFLRKGTLHRSYSRPSKKPKTLHNPRQQPASPPTSNPVDSTSDDESDTAEQEEEKDTGECMVCLREGRTMCIAPCGHFGLCGSCGDPSLFNDIDDSSGSGSKRGGRSSSSSRRRMQVDEEEKKQVKKKRPFELCQICCKAMCEPWVMTREEWVWMGGTVYDA